MNTQHPSVAKLFQEQLDYYSKRDKTAANSLIIALFLDWVKKHKVTRRLKICEFGGAGGLLLKSIQRKYPNSLLTNVEIIEEYHSAQVNKKIKFIRASIIDHRIKKQSFDCIILRDVLHHLIGQNLSKTRENQKKALKEIQKLLKKDGAIFIEELVNQSKLANKLIYYLSKLNSVIGFKIPALEISPHTIIALFSQKELFKITKKIFEEYQISQNFVKTNDPLRFRLIHFVSKVGKLFIVISN